jgi:flagellar motor switch protein FliN/FliY
LNNFAKLFEKEAASVIQNLVGKLPDIKLKSVDQLNSYSNIAPPMAVAKINVSGFSKSGKMLLLIPPTLATALSDMMLGGEGDSKDVMDSDDIDAAKEISNQFFGSMATALKGQKDLPKLEFSVTSVNFIAENQEIDISSMNSMVLFDFDIDSIQSSLTIVFDEATNDAISNKSSSSQQSSNGGSSSHRDSHTSDSNKTHLAMDEIKNIELLLDIKLAVKVRIGSKKMLLRDVINMDLGSVIELDQLVNEPLDILVEDKKIAEGEVVIVDGNFGIQITNINTKRERLEQLAH